MGTGDKTARISYASRYVPSPERCARWQLTKISRRRSCSARTTITTVTSTSRPQIDVDREYRERPFYHGDVLPALPLPWLTSSATTA